MRDDTTLLRLYVQDGSEEAFAELVHRHLRFVYHSALRQCGSNRAQAEDITQEVFCDLARKARFLTGHPSLLSWLLKSTRFSATVARRTQDRRRARETEAATMDHALRENSPATNWEQLQPVLDEALCALSERDRQALLLRFFDDLPFAELGVRLGVSEDAARMRIERALERLRLVLGKRGISSSAAAVGLLMANQPALAAPAGLAAGVCSAALAAGAAAGSPVIAAFVLMNLKTLIPAGVALFALGIAFVEFNRATQAEARATASRQETATLLTRLQAVESQLRPAVVAPASSSLQPAPATNAPASMPPVSGWSTPTPSAAEELNRLAKLRARWTQLTKSEEIVAEMHLSPEKTRRVRDLLLDRVQTQLDGMAVVRSKSDLTPEQRGQALEQALARVDAEIAIELGPDAYANYVKARDVAAMRNSLLNGEIGGALIDADGPLTAVQAGALAEILVELQPTIKTPADRAKVQSDILRRAESVLSPLQVSALRRFYETDEQMGRLMKSDGQDGFNFRPGR